MATLLQSPKEAAAAYIGEMAVQLAQLAREHDLPFLFYLLQLVETEVKQMDAAGPPPIRPPARRDR